MASVLEGRIAVGMTVDLISPAAATRAAVQVPAAPGEGYKGGTISGLKMLNPMAEQCDPL